MVDASGISISVFFPCHNEQDNIAALVEKTLQILPTISDDFEVIVVNDGSTDNTDQVARNLADQHKSVKIVTHPKNRGYGGALQSGFKAAGKEWVFYTDGDGQFDIAELPGILKFIDKYDIVSCYRINRQDSWIRKLNAWAWGGLMRYLFKLKIKDIDCAFKLYRREIFDHISMDSQGALIDTEILARAQRAGYTIIQHPVHHYPRKAGEQSGANVKVILRAFKEMLKLRSDILSSGKKLPPT